MAGLQYMSIDKIKLHLNEISFILDNIKQFNNCKTSLQQNSNLTTNNNINKLTYSDEPYVEISLMDLDNQISNSIKNSVQKYDLIQ